jgi:hypothetical protein
MRKGEHGTMYLSAQLLGEDNRTGSQFRVSGQKCEPYIYYNHSKKVLAQVVDSLFSKHKALSSNSSIIHTKKTLCWIKGNI